MGWSPDRAEPVGPFRGLRTVSLLASRWLWFSLFVGLAALACDALWLQEAGATYRSANRLISLGKLIDASNVVQLAIYVVGGVLFIVWFHRAYGNLGALGVRRPRRRSGWAIGGWFVPFMNLVVPKQLANDIWRSGDPELDAGDAHWGSRPVSGVVHLWWALWILSGVSFRYSTTSMSAADTFDGLHASIVADAVCQVFGVAAAVAAVWVVKRASERQERRARLIDAPGAAALYG